MMRFKDREELDEYILERLKAMREGLEAEPAEEFRYELAKFEKSLLNGGLDEAQIYRMIDEKKRELAKDIYSKIRIELESEAQKIRDRAILDGSSPKTEVYHSDRRTYLDSD
jgi:hypothetical protein